MTALTLVFCWLFFVVVVSRCQTATSAFSRPHNSHHKQYQLPSKSRRHPLLPRRHPTPLYNRLEDTGMIIMEDPDDISMAEVNGNGNARETPPLPKAQQSTSSSSTTVAASSFLTGKEGVCRIEVSRVEWMTTAPWQRTPQTKASGTGFVIEGQYLLTNAHVVKSAVDIRVRKHGSTRRFPARVAVYAPDVDLALLELTGDVDMKQDFFRTHDSSSSTSSSDSLALEFASKLPALQESIHVVGKCLVAQPTCTVPIVT